MSDGRQAQIEALYRAQFPAFLRVATAIVGERDLARDAVQDGFVQAINGAGRFNGDGTLEAWVWQIVVNAARKARRARHRPAELTAALPEVNGRHDDVHAVRAAIAQLTARQRHVLFLRYYADLDYAAIGQALGIREGTVAATLHRAHAALRPQLEELR